MVTSTGKKITFKEMVEKGRSGKLSTVLALKRGAGGRQSDAGTTGSHIRKTSAQNTEKSKSPVSGKSDQKDQQRKGKKGNKEKVVQVNKPITKDISHLAIQQTRLDQIKEENLSNRDDYTSKEQVLKTVCVKKCPEKLQGKRVNVLRKAPPDAEIKPVNHVDYAGPRFDIKGRFIEHSILGTLEEFKEEAFKRGEYEHLFNDDKMKEKKIRRRRKPYESHSLQQWDRQNRDWQRSHAYLADKLGRPVEDLLMRTPNVYPEWVNKRMFVGRAMEARDTGTGEARGTAQFYHLTDSLGGEVGLRATHKKRDKDDVEPVEVIGIPQSVQDEKGSDAWNIHPSYPVYYTPYLQQQEDNVHDYMSKLIPYTPNIEELSLSSNENSGKGVIQGPETSSSTSQGKIILSKSIDEVLDTTANCLDGGKSNVSMESKINGPALKIGDKIAGWDGPGKYRSSQIWVNESIIFDGILDERLMQYIHFENVGSTILHYEWTKIPCGNSFCLVKPRVQRFFFLTEGGVLPPGEKVSVPVIFKSKTAGVFHESWRLDTKPLLEGGASITFHLKAVVRNPWDYRVDFKVIEDKIIRNKCRTIVSEIVNDLLDSIVAPDPPHTPIVRYKSATDIFRDNNPSLYYHSTKLKALQRLYLKVTQNIPQLAEQANEPFSVRNLRKVIFKMTKIQDEDMEEFDLSVLTDEPDEDWDYIKRKFLWHYVRIVDYISFKPLQPYTNWKTNNYKIGYYFLQCMVDKFSMTVHMLGDKMNLPMVMEEEDIGDLDKFEKKKKKKEEREKSAVSSTPSSRMKNKRMSIKDVSIISSNQTRMSIKDVSIISSNQKRMSIKDVSMISSNQKRMSIKDVSMIWSNQKRMSIKDVNIISSNQKRMSIKDVSIISSNQKRMSIKDVSIISSNQKRMSIKDSDRASMSPVLPKEKSNKKGKKPVSPLKQEPTENATKSEEGFFPFNMNEVSSTKQKIFHELLYLKTYNLLQEMADNIADLAVEPVEVTY
ncbi:hypothetical protein FSP39_008109 [Pinctada imbricata]|uniref:MYCBP-associated protein n=1 Tax=Pinctada imbricata TaxID=66713 RepID=A0AA88XZP5_PINIB|nr:hypothetical protein FSP39_008109 [Pinctada imbricata]